MFKLAAVFENAAGRTHRWGYNDPDPTKSPEEIKTALETITTLNLFQKDGIRQFTKVVSAKFVETIETPIFDLSKPTPEAYVADPSNIFSAHIVAEEAPQVSVTPAVNEEKEIAVQKVLPEEIIAPKTRAAVETVKSIEQKPAETAASLTVPVSSSEPLAAVVEKAKSTGIVPSNSAQQLEALTNESTSPAVDSPTVQKPVNSRKAQVDRVRAFHEAKKKKGKKKKR
ncbi:DUF2922 domain-containing protein [Candidatus Enterococcus ferrettii]|uniref:DUF2922 family protein n=1 Tax=Candidatus Enterococcus ferrettii TaxID=2815324 RepID=A0ABV0EMH1_9ENTE|nr:DUF2922 domain-containing protein [Enterococcus sp. 665A]MBO1341375.1 DUF2922 family protein [Enterococcus sp. 665A]